MGDETYYCSCCSYIIAVKKILNETIDDEGRSDIFDREHATYCANKLLVVNIYNKLNRDLRTKKTSCRWDNKRGYLEFEIGKITNDHRIEYYLNEDVARMNMNGDLIKMRYTGKITTYFPDGYKQTEGNYINGIKVGPFTIFYHPSENNMHTPTVMVNGIAGKMSTTYTQNGKISSVSTTISDTLEHQINYYADSVIPTSEGNIIDHEYMHGEWTFWYRTSQIKSVVNYDYGIKNGKSTTYDRTGKKLRTVNYIDGQVLSIDKY